MRKTVLLHVCCAPCSTQAIDVLKNNYRISLLFSNSNIFPSEEYEKRLDDVKKLASLYNMPLIVDPYNHNAWLRVVKEFRNEPEGGKRCTKCFDFNLNRTAWFAKRHKFDYFTTSLTTSYFKSSKDIFKIGMQWDNFLALDFKEKDGFKNSLEKSRRYSLYRQKYCGCEFGLLERKKKLQAKKAKADKKS